MTKILWHSNSPWTPSGYGIQTRLFAPRLQAAGHDVALSCFYGLEGGILDWNGMRCYPTDHTRFGRARLHELADHFGQGDPVQVITLMDVWALIDGAHRGENLRQLNLASWVPVDHDPVPPRVLQFFELTGARPIAMARHGQQALLNAGLDARYVPHGVDTTVYRPLDRKAECRAKLGLPADAFVVGMVANNQGNMPPRKAFPQVFQAFADLRRRRPDAMLYLHRHARPQPGPQPDPPRERDRRSDIRDRDRRPAQAAPRHHRRGDVPDLQRIRRPRLTVVR